MDFKYLQIFVAIADAGTLTAAAENLHIAQSALSRHLRNIEEEYGAQLMLRGSRRMKLTDEGRILYVYAKKTLLWSDSIHKEIHDLSVGLSGTLRLGTVPNLFNVWLETVFPRFHKDFPNVKFDIYEERSDILIQRLWDGLCDIALIRTPVKLSGWMYFTLRPTLLWPATAASSTFRGAGLRSGCRIWRISPCLFPASGTPGFLRSASPPVSRPTLWR